MKRLLLCLAFLVAAPAAMALAPYVYGTRLPAADLPAQISIVEKKLQAAGFTVVGRHTPKGLPHGASVIVTDAQLLAALGHVGGSAISAAGLRVGVQADGTVSFANPEYWHRAFVRKQYPQVQAAVQSVQARLTQALGIGQPFGGDVPVDELANYNYMFGMEKFDSDNSLVATHDSFDKALATVRDHLSKGVVNTSKVYEVVLPERKVAVFGVAMNHPSDGEGWWVNKIEGGAHIAALPYEIFIVDNKVYALYARFRIALGWPALGMGQFMGIFGAPNTIQYTMQRVAANP